MAKLPGVPFSGLGTVTAADAVRVREHGHGLSADVYVLHPDGGRVYLALNMEPGEAAALRLDLQGALTAWAKLS